MYNLEVQEDHTFFVGTQGWLVHNSSCDPFEIAKNGGRHAGWYKDILQKSDRKLEQGIRSLEKQIAEHEGYIANPKSKISNWDSLDPREQQGLLNKKWPGDIARQEEQKAILKGILSERRGK